MPFAYEQQIRDEVSRWPGAGVTFAKRAKHDQATVTFGGDSRFVVIPATPSDNRRGALNSLGDVRRELERLGAQRRTAEARQPQRRRAAPRVQRDAFAYVERAPVGGNPFDALSTLVTARASYAVRIIAARGRNVRRIG